MVGIEFFFQEPSVIGQGLDRRGVAEAILGKGFWREGFSLVPVLRKDDPRPELWGQFPHQPGLYCIGNGGVEVWCLKKDGPCEETGLVWGRNAYRAQKMKK